MALADDYAAQFAWRDWGRAMDELPIARDQRVLDLGCAIGDQAILLRQRGARVLGIDGNADLVEAACTRIAARGIDHVEFSTGEVHPLDVPASSVDGIWSSFTAAYLVDLPDVLRGWRRCLWPGGWLALVEAEDMFAHEPLSPATAAAFAAYADDALAQRRYDFGAGRKLADAMRAAGFTVVKEMLLRDDEFACDGPAAAGVVQAWERRFDRMQLLQQQLGDRFAAIRREFLAALVRPDHRSRCRVHCCVGRAARSEREFP